MLKTKEYEMEEAKNQENWRMVSRVFDRVTMIVFILITLFMVVFNLFDLVIKYKQHNNDDIIPRV